ncbi:MAG: phosphoribosylanthranilate isomerase [Daejeonella sp.]
MIIKVCGMRDPANIKDLSELKPDYMGFIFYSDSKRFIGNAGAELLASVDSMVKRAGVFVNEAMDVIADKVLQYQLDAVQLHGEEAPEFCRSLRKFLRNMQTEKHVEIIKAFGVSEEFDFDGLSAYEDFVDYFLFDTKTVLHGGSGVEFDWNLLKKYNGIKPYFLSGGLSHEHINMIKLLKDTRLYGLDLNSRFEVEPGMKNIEMLRLAFELIRN